MFKGHKIFSYIISFKSTDQNDPDPNDHDQNDRDRNVPYPNDRDRNVPDPNDRDQNDLDPKRTETQKMIQLQRQFEDKQTDRLNSSIDIDSIGQYVAVLYTEPRPQYYWGIMTKTFYVYEEKNLMKTEVDFLQKKMLSSDPSLWTWTEKTKKDIDIVSVNYVLLRPLQPNVMKGLFHFPDVEATGLLRNLGLHWQLGAVVLVACS